MTTVLGTTKDSFLARTKTALESFIGSPIKSDSKIRQFITEQFGLQNEHLIPEMFAEPAKKERRSVYLLSLYSFDSQEDGQMVLESDNIRNRLANTQDELEAGMRELFASVFPDSDNAGSDLLNYRLVTDRIEELTESTFDPDDADSTDSDNMGDLESDFANFSTTEAIDWLFENIDIDSLCDDLLPDLTQNHYQIKWEVLYLD